jgi:carbon storage regulator
MHGVQEVTEKVGRLVITRKPGETIILDGNVRITVETAGGNRTKLVIQAPKTTKVLRSELASAIAD